MSDIDTLLDNELNDGKTILKIDEPTRTIKYSTDLFLGVEKDYQAERIYFESPRIVGDNIDLSSDSVQIYIDFKNGYNEPYIYECTDKTLQDNDTVLFSWLLTEKVTVTKGTVEFMVCAKNAVDGLIHNEWHTVPFKGYVEKGIDVSQKTPEIIADNTASTAALIEEIKVLEYKVDNAVGFTKEEVQDLLVEKVDRQEMNDSLNELNIYISAKANASDVYKKSETFSKNEVESMVSTIESTIDKNVQRSTWKDYGTSKISIVSGGIEVYFAMDAGVSNANLAYIAASAKNCDELMLHVTTKDSNVTIGTNSSYVDDSGNHDDVGNVNLDVGTDNAVIYEAMLHITKIGNYYYWIGTSNGTVATKANRTSAMSAKTKYPFFTLSSTNVEYDVYVTVCGRGGTE